MSSSTIRARYPTGATSHRGTGAIPRRVSLIVDGAPLGVVAGGQVTVAHRRAVFLDSTLGFSARGWTQATRNAWFPSAVARMALVEWTETIAGAW